MNTSTAMDCRGRRILVAGIGNIFLGDDGFGVEVAQKLLKRSYSSEVQIVDFGIRGVELAYTLLDDYDVVILIDATPRGGKPGTLYLLEPDLSACNPEKGAETGRAALDAHSMDPAKVLAFATTLGASLHQVFLVGCEPLPSDDNNEYSDVQVGLSEAVQSAVDEAVDMLGSLLERLFDTWNFSSNVPKNGRE